MARVIDPIEQAACAILFHTPATRRELALWISAIVSDASYIEDVHEETWTLLGKPYAEDQVTFHLPGEEQACRLADRALCMLARSVVHHRRGGAPNMSPGAFDALPSVTLNTDFSESLTPSGLARDIVVCMSNLLNAQAVQIDAMEDDR